MLRLSVTKFYKNSKFIVIILLSPFLLISFYSTIKYGWLNGLKNSSSITQDADTSNWKSYVNDEFGIEFLYPPDWFLQTSDNSYEEVVLHIKLGKKGEKYFLEGSEVDSLIDIVITNSEDKNIKEIVKKYKKGLVGGTIEKTTIANQVAYVRKNYLGSVYFTLKNGKQIEIAQINLGSKDINAPINEVVEGIVSSFSFIK